VHEVHVDPLAVGALHAVTDVLGDGAVQHLRILRDIGDVPTQRVLGDPGDVLAVDLDQPIVAIGIAQQQLGQSRLARAGRSDQTDVLPRLNAQVQSLEERGSTPVGESQALELDATVRHHHVGRIREVDDVGLRRRDAGELRAAADGA
jgi:hypothetical protein